jgi:hypothetical protein
MMQDKDEDAFVERIAKALRTVERAGAAFDERTMSAVYAAAREAKAATKSWWTRERTIHVTPLATLALAASLAAVVVGGSYLLSARDRAEQRNRDALATPDTVHIVRFVLVNPAADRVALIGAFNHWDKHANALRQADGSGIWTADVPLPRGRYEYAFVVYDENGEHWLTDPVSPTVHDEFGTETSIISVGSSAL